MAENVKTSRHSQNFMEGITLQGRALTLVPTTEPEKMADP